MDPAQQIKMSMATHAPAIVNMMRFAQRAFAYAFTYDEALNTPVVVALERLPEGDRFEGRQLLKEFLDAWKEVRETLEFYDACGNEVAAVGMDNMRIENLVGLDDGSEADAVVLTVGRLTGLPGEELEPSNPVPRMLIKRLFKDHNDMVYSSICCCNLFFFFWLSCSFTIIGVHT
jgi:hypothetical protein